MKIWVVCVDEIRGRFLAYEGGGERGWGRSEEEAVVELLRKTGGVEITRVEKDA